MVDQNDIAALTFFFSYTARGQMRGIDAIKEDDRDSGIDKKYT